ncbi:MAG: 16S rRNA processing protein RimM [Bacilli bacterium]|nr:16S rRNA processing protein RimM [Bacilli bacterium]
MLYIGMVAGTHGIKGEIRISSDFKYKDLVFKKGNHLYIDDDNLVINTYRVHKNYDMVTFENINDINDVLKYKGKEVYIDRGEYVFPDLLNEDLIGADVYGNGEPLGVLAAIRKNVNQELLVVKNDEKEYLIPNVSAFVKNKTKDRIDVDVIEGLLE